jgi:hypothetical protein
MIVAPRPAWASCPRLWTILPYQQLANTVFSPMRLKLAFPPPEE